jgi:aminoglycoside phosphotransferase (APT) family kinase protein
VDPRPDVDDPSDEALNWAAKSIAPGATVTSVRRLTGGITSAMHALSVVDERGRHQRCVLRRWLSGGVHEGSTSVQREALILVRLEAIKFPAPRLIDVDARGERCGHPALLMSYLDGHVELTPRDPHDWLLQIATMLARIHRSETEAPVAESWLNRDNLEVPQWSHRPDLWREAFALMDERPPTAPSCFIHHDYQQFNLLWQRGKLTSVVDWVWGSSGSPSIDVAHLRLNFSVLYSSELAEQFLLRYEEISGRVVERWWDVEGLLHYLPGWGTFLQQQAGRRLIVDFEGMHARVEATLQAALRRDT